MTQPSYSQAEIDRWLSLTPEERVFEGESLWNEFLVKNPQKAWKPFWKSFDSFEELREWRNQQENPVLW